jgi:hypothetical protein
MYVEAVNPTEFFDVEDGEKTDGGSGFYVMVYAFSDYESEVQISHFKADDDKNSTNKTKAEKERKEKAKEQEDEAHKKKLAKKRTCVKLPGVRLAEVQHTRLKTFVDDEDVATPENCTAQCEAGRTVRKRFGPVETRAVTSSRWQLSTSWSSRGFSTRATVAPN